MTAGNDQTQFWNKMLEKVFNQGWHALSMRELDDEIYRAAQDAPEYFCRSVKVRNDLFEDLRLIAKLASGDGMSVPQAIHGVAVHRDLCGVEYEVRNGVREDIAESILQYFQEMEEAA